MLVKVWSASGMKKAVVADDLQSLLEKGKEKLQLSNDVAAYMEDGTEIDEDDIFKCMADASVVYLLQENDKKPWIVKADQSPACSDVTETLNHVITDSPRTKLCVSPWPSVFVVSDEKFSSDLRAALETGEDLNWVQKTELLHQLLMEIIKYTEYPTTQQRQQVATALIDKYPALKSSIGDGTQAWCTRLYDKLREYRRQKRKSDSLRTGQSIGQNEVTSKQVKRRRGEINWAPPLPDGEDINSIKAHEEWLLKEFQKPEQVVNKIVFDEKIELSFANRRKVINNNDKSINELKMLYPYLFSVAGIINEFKLLMAIDIHEAFSKEINNLAPKLLKILQRKKKIPEEVQIIMNRYNSQQEYHVTNTVIAAIAVLPSLLTEKPDILFKEYADETSVEDIFKGPITPHVAVIGSIFSSSLIFVVAEKKLLFQASDFLMAVKSLLGLYYCCNIEYPSNGKRLYQFLELKLLDIQYQKSHSRRVVTLIDEINKM